MRVSTLALGDNKFGGETTLPSTEFRSQWSRKIRMDLPSLILQRASFAIIFLECKIFFYANETEADFASKMELFKKYGPV